MKNKEREKKGKGEEKFMNCKEKIAIKDAPSLEYKAKIYFYQLLSILDDLEPFKVYIIGSKEEKNHKIYNKLLLRYNSDPIFSDYFVDIAFCEVILVKKDEKDNIMSIYLKSLKTIAIDDISNNKIVDCLDSIDKDLDLVFKDKKKDKYEGLRF